MSGRLAVCPHCSQVGLHTDLPEQTLEFLDLVLTHHRINHQVWRVRGLLCQRCEMPYLVVFPAEMPLDERRLLVHNINDTLTIN